MKKNVIYTSSDISSNFSTLPSEKIIFGSGDASTKNVNFASTSFPQNSFSPTLCSSENVKSIDFSSNSNLKLPSSTIGISDFSKTSEEQFYREQHKEFRNNSEETFNLQKSLVIEKNKNDSFQKSINNYIKKYNPYVYILTPCFGGVNYVNYTISLINTINTFRQLGIPLQISFCKNDSLVSRARNNLIAKALYNEKTTHCMFIDNDITWEPNDILKLLLSNKPLIGGIYPLKKYSWDKLTKNDNIVSEWIKNKNTSQLEKSITNEDYIQNKMLSYNVNYLEPVLKIVDNIAKVRHIATGFMLIQRNTLLEMMNAFSYTKYKDDVGFLEENENKYAYALFDCSVEEGHYFSEDWLFCHRWSKMGGEVYIDVTINLTHTGIEDYKGSYISSII